MKSIAFGNALAGIRQFYYSIMKLPDPQEQADFEAFGASRVSLKTMLMCISLFGICASYFFIFALWNLNTKWNESLPFLIILVLTALFCQPVFIVLLYAKKHQNDEIKSTLTTKLISYIPFMESILVITSTVSMGACTIFRAYNGECDNLYQTSIYFCNSGYASRSLPGEQVLVVMLIPILYSIVFRSVRFDIVCLSWILVIISLLIAIGISDSHQTYLSLGLYIPLSATMLYENQRQNLIVYFIVKREKQLLAENKQMAEDQQTEMRHMIANVAHDLKTPLSAFMNGLEVIADSLETAVESRQRLGMNFNVTPITIAVKENLVNLFNVNSFMTMTINRCIDYTKASKGMKLESRLETINLSEILALPINCMKDLQSRGSINLLPLPSDICSHIITDKQWLQENLFCLISNAVKYSSGDTSVTIQASLITHDDPRVLSSSVKHNNNDDKMGNQQHYSVDATAKLPKQNQQQQHTIPTAPSDQLTKSCKDSLPPLVPSSPHQPSGINTTNRYTYFDKLNANSAPRQQQHDEHMFLFTAQQQPQQDKNNSVTENAYHAEEQGIVKLTAKPTAETNTAVSRSHCISKHNKVHIAPENHDTTTDTIVQSTDPKQQQQQTHPPQKRTDTSKRPPSLAISSSNKTCESCPATDATLLLFEVEDTGIGLSDDMLHSLFMPFKQAQRRAGGTGLGLYSLAKRLEALGGYYGVQRRRDGECGSLFWFAIPYTPDPTANITLSSAGISRSSTLGHITVPSTSRETSSPVVTTLAAANSTDISNTQLSSAANVNTPWRPHHSLNVLVVDDSVPVLKMTSMLLKRQKYIVTQAENGAEALSRIHERKAMVDAAGAPLPPFDVILMDLNMPVMDGLEATTRIRSLERENDSKQLLSADGDAPAAVEPFRHFIVGFSANSDHQTMMEAYESGVDDFMCKPFSLQTFHDCYRKQWNKMQSHLNPSGDGVVASRMPVNEWFCNL